MDRVAGRELILRRAGAGEMCTVGSLKYYHTKLPTAVSGQRGTFAGWNTSEQVKDPNYCNQTLAP